MHIINSSKHVINTTIAIDGKLQTHINVKNIRGEVCKKKDWWKCGVYKAAK